MNDQEDYIKLGKNIFDNDNQGRKEWACLGQSCSKPLIVYFSQFFVIFLKIFGWFWRSNLSKTCDESKIWVGILVVQLDTLYHHQHY